jgi:hypothetical protein
MMCCVIRHGSYSKHTSKLCFAVITCQYVNSLSSDHLARLVSFVCEGHLYPFFITVTYRSLLFFSFFITRSRCLTYFRHIELAHSSDTLSTAIPPGASEIKLFFRLQLILGGIRRSVGVGKGDHQPQHALSC